MAKKKRATDKPPPENPAAAAGGQPGEKGDKAKEKLAWRSGMELITLIAGALLVAFVIKATAFDVYLIPSGSMETVLHGRPDGGDRIFCSKLNYHFRNPERWEVAVFLFPFETALANDPEHVSVQYEGQNFVKRVVGLPGETLAISRGDIWTRPNDNPRAGFQRQVKPDAVQRRLWLKVYAEDFSDISREELETFWKILGDEVSVLPGGTLRLAPGMEAVRLDYRPMVPVGGRDRQMIELPGVPDRYVLRQPVQFKCAAVREDGTVCDHVFVKTFETQNMLARCPRCGTLLDESAAAFYHRRTGLPTPKFSRYGVSPQFAVQGEKSLRDADYHFVPDLRVVTDAVLAGEKSSLGITLREDNRFVQAIFHGNGVVEVQVNGEPSRPEQRTVAGLRPGKSHRFEFYVVDGVARVFADDSKQALLDLPVWDDKKAQPLNIPRASGVSLSAAGGDVDIADVAIDRDIFYYSGKEREKPAERFAMMSAQGEVFVGKEAFFPMGDHCPSSYDARSWGPVPLSLLRGPAIAVWWPPDRVGLIGSR